MRNRDDLWFISLSPAEPGKHDAGAVPPSPSSSSWCFIQLGGHIQPSIKACRAPHSGQRSPRCWGGKQGRALSAGDGETIPLVLFSWRDAFLRHNTEFPQSSEPRIFSCGLIKNMTLSLKLAFVLKRSCLPGELIPLIEVTSLEVLLLSSISWLR